MNRCPTPPCRRVPTILVALALPLALLLGCSEADHGSSTASAGFTVSAATATPVLVEGEESGVRIPLTVTRAAGHTAPVSLALEGVAEADVANVSGAFAAATLGPGDAGTELVLQLAVGDRAIAPGTRRFLVAASDGQRTTRTELAVSVEPTDAPDVYLLIGQSNMVGASGENTQRAEPGGPDEPDPRIEQLNVSPNDPFELFTSDAVFRSPERNVLSPYLVEAEDPLHEPVVPGREDKGFGYIGLGLSFAKSALGDVSRRIVLVPAAWSGSAFCDNENGPRGQWNARPSDRPELGNTLLFERAVVRANTALAETGGILRGILWHQGESDSNLPCAALYANNLELLAEELRTRIDPDRRGAALRAPDAPIPFVVGTMSRGTDERGDYSDFNDAKRRIDEAHRAIGTRVAHSAVSVHDDLVPANGYPCGVGDCIHFGAEALREMGRRYHAALQRALGD